MEHYIWLFNRNDYKGLAGSFLGSLLFHALLFAILATTSIYYPLTGETEKLDVVWLYPSFLLGGSTGPAEQVEVSPVKAVPPPEKVEPPQAAPAKAPVPARESPPPPPPVSEAVVKPVVTVPPAEEPEPQEEPEMKMPAAFEPLPEVKAEEPRVEKPPIKNAKAPETKKAAAPEPKPAAEELKKPAPPTKEAVAAKEVESTTPPAVKEAVRPASEKPEAPPVAASRQQPAAAAVPSREKTVTAETPTPVTPALPAPQPALLPPGIPGEAKTIIVQKAAEPVPAAKPAPAVKADGEPRPKTAEVKGIFIPPISGDLKLEIVGKDDVLRRIKVAVLFREFPKARRARPLSKAEARRVQALTPKLARTGDSTQQVVIEVAGEGVYEFTVETDSAQPVEASFAVKLYDNGSKARIKPVGTRRIAHRLSIVKILMPDGILWTEDAAFSGSMEDSDSITKFNVDSGLVWKEYY